MVQISLEDVNDNAPIFTQYPFTVYVSHTVQSGYVVANIKAEDKDSGINGEILYELVPTKSSSKFRLDLNTGVLVVTQSLSHDNGNVIYLEITARDKGYPTMTSSGLVELKIGDNFDRQPLLRFQNETYFMQVRGKAAEGMRLGSVHAITTNGRRFPTTYSIIKGNEKNFFTIDTSTGEISIAKDSKDHNLFWEPMYKLGVMAKTKDNPAMYAYCQIDVSLSPFNVQPLKFTQQHYYAFISEGRFKGTFVSKVSAFSDQGKSRQILYHIVDGNHDNAFVIEPAYGGSVKTNIVLDREVRDFYRLKIIATDVGVTQMTATSTLLVRVLDLNDNQPTFPLNTLINVSEG